MNGVLVDVLYYIFIAFVSYFIGTVNFSKIIAWYFRHKDITKVGSGNPGTMNMLRSFGFGLALSTFIAEVAKAGLTCFIFQLLFPEYPIVYFFSGLFVLLGYIFPVWSKFKGGKGVACFAGIFLFSELWYVALGWFAICFILFLFINYGSVISFTYIGGLTIAYTIYVWVANVPYAWAITAILWFLYALMLFKHRGNIKRLINHTESKIDFKAKIKKVFCHKKGEEIIDEEQVIQKPEKEIVIEDNATQNQDQTQNQTRADSQANTDAQTDTTSQADTASDTGDNSKKE